MEREPQAVIPRRALALYVATAIVLIGGAIIFMIGTTDEERSVDIHYAVVTGVIIVTICLLSSLEALRRRTRA